MGDPLADLPPAQRAEVERFDAGEDIIDDWRPLTHEEMVTTEPLIMNDHDDHAGIWFDCLCGRTSVQIERGDACLETTCHDCGRIYRLRLEVKES